MGCLGPQTISSQAALNNFLTDCIGGGGFVAPNIQVDGPLQIQNYTDEIVRINGTTTVSIDNGIIISGENNIVEIHIEGGEVALLDGHYGAADDKPHGLLVQDVPNLAFMNITTLGGISNFTLQNLPKLRNISSSTLHVSGGGTINIGNTGLSDQHLLFGCDSSAFDACDSDDASVFKPRARWKRNELARRDDGSHPLSHVIIRNNTGPLKVEFSTITNISSTFLVEDSMGLNSNTGSTISMPQLDSANNISVANIATLSLPLLQSANSISITNLVKFSLPKLEHVKHDLVMTNSTFDILDAPSLKTVSLGEITITDLPELQQVNFPALQSIGGSLQIARNPNLVQLSQLGFLESVGAYINISGSFDTVTFQSLKKVGKGIELNSNGTSFSCATVDFKNVAGKNYSCVDKHSTAADPKGDNTSPSNTQGPINSTSVSPTSKPSSSALSGGAVAGLVIGIVAFLVVCSGIAFLWWKRRKELLQENRSSTFYGRVEMEQQSGPTSRMAEVPGESVGSSELEGDVKVMTPQELGSTPLGSVEVQEMAASTKGPLS